MSWYGVHPRRSKEEVKNLLPPGACKNCIYWFRVAIGSKSTGWYQEFSNCPRCGIPQWELLDKLTADEAIRKTQVIGTGKLDTTVTSTPIATLLGNPVGIVIHPSNSTTRTNPLNRAISWIGDVLRGKIRWVRNVGWCDEPFVAFKLHPITAPTKEQIQYVQNLGTYAELNFLQIRELLQQGDRVALGVHLPEDAKVLSKHLQRLAFTFSIVKVRGYRPR